MASKQEEKDDTVLASLIMASDGAKVYTEGAYQCQTDNINPNNGVTIKEIN